ncbi:COG1361 S-layer family protein [Halorarum halobium]|uniref:COG1361 S-layer family protein n=1 Tax=Halorarum halobium TaxID=3075121 RepID=UPI0028A9AB3E|nr:COG1361 S-layer family protein [Halobaculum sp. XH14]
MSRRSIVVCFVVLLVAVPMAVSAVDIRFETSVPEPNVQPGASQELTFQLTNDAYRADDRADTAREVEVTVRGGDTNISVQSGVRSLGTMRDGVPQTVSVQIQVPADIPAGTHELPVRVEYLDADDDRETKTVTVPVRVEERARFVVEDVDTTVPVGGSGTVTVNVTNEGEEAASNAVLAFQSGNADVTFSTSATTRRFVGEWEPNETKSVEVDASVANSAETREYAVDTTVEYEDTDGIAATSQPLSFGLTPLSEQTFGVEGVESTLRVGDDGTMTGTVTNTGERTARNVVVMLETSNPNVSPLETEAAVGDLEPGQSAEFAFDVSVSDSAEAGARQFGLTMQYRDDEGTQRTSESTDVRVEVGEERDEFGVSPVDASFEVGSGGELVLELTNNRETAVSDVSAKLFADAPLSSADDEAFVPELGPGETAEVVFDLSVAGSATDKTYPLSVDFQYETAEGDTRISDAYQVPVEVTEPEGGGLPLPVLGGVAALLVLLGAGVYYRRR